MSEGREPVGLLRRLWRIVNGPVIGPIILALLVAGLGYWLILAD